MSGTGPWGWAGLGREAGDAVTFASERGSVARMIRADQGALTQLLQLGLVMLVSGRQVGGRGRGVDTSGHPQAPSSAGLPGESRVRPAKTAHRCHHRIGRGFAAGPCGHGPVHCVYAEEVLLLLPRVSSPPPSSFRDMQGLE